MKKSAIIGAFEKVSFPEFGMNEMVAKIDTGAYTGAIHCTKINEEETPDGILLHFSPFDHPEIVKTTDNFFIKHVKSSNGETEQRYFVDTQIVVNGETYPIVISLADRSGMKWPVLIGRRFMLNNNLLVDVNRRKK